MIDVSPPGAISAGYGINASGLVVGSAMTGINDIFGFIYGNGKTTQINGQGLRLLFLSVNLRE
jgi:hypothetical protein